MSGSSAKQIFEDTRSAVSRLHDVQLALMNRCEEWRPPSARSRSAKPDPTAHAAIYNVDELEGKLSALRQEESELLDKIGIALVLVEAVRAGLGDKYALALELHYIDRVTWDEAEERLGVSKVTGWRYIDIACDWIDSIGFTKITAGDYEI